MTAILVEHYLNIGNIIALNFEITSIEMSETPTKNYLLHSGETQVFACHDYAMESYGIESVSAGPDAPDETLQAAYAYSREHAKSCGAISMSVTVHSPVELSACTKALVGSELLLGAEFDPNESVSTQVQYPAVIYLDLESANQL